MHKRILIVDDDPGMCQLLKMRLESLGFSADTARAGREAIGTWVIALAEEPYDLILLDILLPDIPGIEVLSAVRKEEELRGVGKEKGVPIIMLTAAHNEITTSFTLGCDDYVLKPFDVEELLKKIRSKIG